jgi:hypothetical protein
VTAVGLLAIGVIFSIGVITGVILVVSLASRREDRRARLSREAPDRVTQAGRFLTGLEVRRPGEDIPRRDHPDDDQTAEFSGPWNPAPTQPAPTNPAPTQPGPTQLGPRRLRPGA